MIAGKIRQELIVRNWPDILRLAAIIIYWNTAQLGEIVARLSASEGAIPDPELLAHVSPLGWEHIHLAGEYRWHA